MKKLGFIGVGNMGGAILKGIEGKLGNTAVFAYDANSEKLADLTQVGATAAGSAKEIADKCDYILLAVKPQHLAEVLAEIKESVKPETVFISICAGSFCQHDNRGHGWKGRYQSHGQADVLRDGEKSKKAEEQNGKQHHFDEDGSIKFQFSKVISDIHAAKNSA